jgi:hypothetical protein
MYTLTALLGDIDDNIDEATLVWLKGTQSTDEAQIFWAACTSAPFPDEIPTNTDELLDFLLLVAAVSPVKLQEVARAKFEVELAVLTPQKVQEVAFHFLLMYANKPTKRYPWKLSKQHFADLCQVVFLVCLLAFFKFKLCGYLI